MQEIIRHEACNPSSKASYVDFLDKCFLVSALASDNDVPTVKKNLASLIRQLAAGVHIVFDTSIEDISPPIAQAIADKIIDRSGLDIMAAIDDLPIPSDPSTVVKKLVSTMMDRLFSLQQPAILPNQPIPSPPQQQPTGSEMCYPMR